MSISKYQLGSLFGQPMLNNILYSLNINCLTWVNTNKSIFQSWQTLTNINRYQPIFVIA